MIQIPRTCTLARRTPSPARPLAILLALLAGVASALAAETRGTREPATADRPDIIFRNYCSVCHGEKGDGKSFARFALDPPPADFTSAKTRAKLSRAHMLETVRKGAPGEKGRGTAMVSRSKQLRPEQIEAVVDYVIVKFMDGKVALNAPAKSDDPSHKGHDHSNTKHVDYPYGLSGSPERGKAVYQSSCANCHGERGDGKGREAAERSLRPRNFRDADFREFASGFSLYSAVARGGGAMPEFEKTMPRQSIADVSEYVLREFIKPRRVPGKGR